MLRYGQQEGGTHPTVMHSCFRMLLSLYLAVVYEHLAHFVRRIHWSTTHTDNESFALPLDSEHWPVKADIHDRSIIRVFP